MCAGAGCVEQIKDDEGKHKGNVLGLMKRYRVPVSRSYEVRFYVIGRLALPVTARRALRVAAQRDYFSRSAFLLSDSPSADWHFGVGSAADGKISRNFVRGRRVIPNMNVKRQFFSRAGGLYSKNTAIQNMSDPDHCLSDYIIQ